MVKNRIWKGEWENEQLEHAFDRIGNLCALGPFASNCTGGTSGTACSWRNCNRSLCAGGGQFNGCFHRGIHSVESTCNWSIMSSGDSWGNTFAHAQFNPCIDCAFAPKRI